MTAPRSVAALFVATSLVACGAPSDGGAAPDGQPAAEVVAAAANDASHARSPPPPTAPVPEAPPPIPEEFADCTRGPTREGVLAELPEYRMERTPDYAEIESAVLPGGVPVTIIHAGCDHMHQEVRFRLESGAGELTAAEAFTRAEELLTVMWEATSWRSARYLSRRVGEALAGGGYALGEDLEGEYFEGDVSIGVLLEEEDGTPVIVVEMGLSI